MTCIATTIPSADETSDCPPPVWVRELFHGRASREERSDGSATVTRWSNSQYTLVTVCLPGASELGDEEFRLRTTDCYFAVSAALHGRTPARFWNHIPRIHDPACNDMDRYMVFNAGRYEAFVSWYGQASQFDTRLATASGIGHGGSDLIIHCLATDLPVLAIDNPRQIPPHRYSARFGPQPPCFARATRVGNLLLVGGTASVRGEDSVHVADLARQTEETFANLDSLLAAANETATRAVFRELRVYYPCSDDTGAIIRSVRGAFPRLHRLELMPADLCRKELLIEIEGLAEF